MVVAAVDWTQVLLGLIAGLPAIIAAIASVRVHRDIRTPSGRAIGTEMESVRHMTVGNAHRIESVRRRVGAEPPLEVPDEPGPREVQPPSDV